MPATAKFVPATLQRADGAPWPVDEASDFLSISVRSLRAKIAEGTLPAIRIGGRVLIPDAVIRRVSTEGL